MVPYLTGYLPRFWIHFFAFTLRFFFRFWARFFELTFETFGAFWAGIFGPACGHFDLGRGLELLLFRAGLPGPDLVAE